MVQSASELDHPSPCSQPLDFIFFYFVSARSQFHLQYQHFLWFQGNLFSGCGVHLSLHQQFHAFTYISLRWIRQHPHTSSIASRDQWPHWILSWLFSIMMTYIELFITIMNIYISTKVSRVHLVYNKNLKSKDKDGVFVLAYNLLGRHEPNEDVLEHSYNKEFFDLYLTHW